MYDIVPIVNNTVLYTWKFGESLETHVKHSFNDKMKKWIDDKWIKEGINE